MIEAKSSICYNKENQAGTVGPCRSRGGGRVALADRRGSTLSPEEQIHALHEKFQYPHSRICLWLEEAPFKDVEKSLLYAWMAECDPGQVLNMRKKEPWERIQRHLHLTPDRYQIRWHDYCADRLHRWWGVDKAQALRLLQEGWPMHYIKMAALLSVPLSMDMKTILQKRTRECRWRTWAVERMGMDGDRYDSMMQAARNPSLPPRKEKQESAPAERNRSL